ncbi:MAG: hypothetical protein ABW206_10115 [Agrobacterium vaccinii]
MRDLMGGRDFRRNIFDRLLIEKIGLASSLPDHIRLTVFSALNGCVVENKNNQEVNE